MIMFECMNCGKSYQDVEELKPLELATIFERVAPGEPMPAGECPACGAVCHSFAPEVEPEDVEKFAAMIRAEIEDEIVPDQVLAWARKHQGKRLNSRSLPDGFKIRPAYGMMHIDNEAWERAGEKDSYHFLLAHKMVNVQVPSPEELRRLNPAYYEGREKRNEQRRELLADPVELHHQTRTFSRMVDAVADYRAALEEFSKVFGYPYPDRYMLERAAGIIQEARK